MSMYPNKLCFWILTKDRNYDNILVCIVKDNVIKITLSLDMINLSYVVTRVIQSKPICYTLVWFGLNFIQKTFKFKPKQIMYF